MLCERLFDFVLIENAFKLRLGEILPAKIKEIIERNYKKQTEPILRRLVSIAGEEMAKKIVIELGALVKIADKTKGGGKLLP
ncbi:MAG: hypothetical protein HYW50_00910 [Candidatus Diapherotrites archaeon]|nr:hypothetical protein [Candidatus Diapherotrites archaeon]